MKSKFSDADVLNLLNGLKNAESNYPLDMISARRDTYMQQAANIIATKQAGGGNASSSTSDSVVAGGGIASSAGTLLEIAITIAIVAEAGVTSYLYRNQISKWINTVFSPRVERSINPTDNSISPLLINTPIESTETATETPVVTITVTTSGTPEPITVPDSNKEQVNATPAAPQDNPGNHYGNTPKPERTKDTQPNNNNGNVKNK